MLPDSLSIIIFEAEAFMHEVELEPEHVKQVRFLSKSLFEQTKSLHKLEEHHGELLQAAALLHDIGWTRSPTGSKHHKISAEMILEHVWESVSLDDILIISQIARYHRKKLPCAKHQAFRDQPEQAQHIIQSMSALLRIADALDHSHSSLVTDTIMRERNGDWVLSAISSLNCASEMHAFKKKSDLFVQYFKVPIHLEFQMPEDHPYSARKQR